MHGVPEQKHDSCWGRQPRPLENGNWVCEDPHCANVNYPRRTECFKCRKRRGPLGDAIVRAFIDKMKLVKGNFQQNRIINPVGMATSSFPLTKNKLDPWIRAVPQQYPLEAPHFEAEQCHFAQRPATFSAMTEGKRLAEHLISCFAASSDPIRDAAECLTSAALWLQTLKPRFHTAEEQSLSVSSLVSIGSPAFGSLSLGLNSSVNMVSQPRYGANLGSGAIAGVPNTLNRPTSSMSASSNSRPLVHASLKWEDYKDRPSDFLREFGDPAAVTAAAFGGGLKPEPGVNGNWECEDCKNVNFPRRTSCFQCRRKRGVKGDELVRKYVRGLFSDGDTIWSS
ncbi:hypothetical protein KP509_02G007700 [Ceratopteris richardii]|nr:hypothetical protein KP509_02G007700 [Ceratopteris richardii]KAH7442915.1 hypothetical protein KP509_02G007700 [Ceratopteris richardii]